MSCATPPCSRRRDNHCGPSQDTFLAAALTSPEEQSRKRGQARTPRAELGALPSRHRISHIFGRSTLAPLHYNVPIRRLEQFHTWCIGWSTASAVQFRIREPALATEGTETLPQALKRAPATDGRYARLKGVLHPSPIHQM